MMEKFSAEIFISQLINFWQGSLGNKLCHGWLFTCPSTPREGGSCVNVKILTKKCHLDITVL